ncbi:MAG: FAD/NAD(P)-binding protein, partial [Candidatus Bipolaricaulota bacterium]|nr:FAD/NAD(P)-binding protein [Candidatus Bipolaricaulota bacterium]
LTSAFGHPSPVQTGEGSGVRAFAPGQFNMLYLFGVGEVPISISGDPAQPEVLVHTVRAVGAVTKAICALKRGEVVGVRGPFGSGWPLTEAVEHDVVIVAGGVGLAPLRPAIYHLLNHRSEYGRIALLYGARTPQDMLYKKELAEWRGRFDIQVEVTVDAAKPDEWRGNVGVVTTLIPKASFDPFHTTALVCGPEVMMRFTMLELQKRELRDEQIYISMERNMKCAIGFCGHCQYGPNFVCKDGPVFRFDRVKELFGKREV